MAKKEEAPVEAPDLGSISHVVEGAAAHDPLASKAPTAALINADTWIAAKKLRAVDIAGFAAWARLNAPAVLTADEWASLAAAFKTTPIR
jgi:hypothetical protein